MGRTDGKLVKFLREGLQMNLYVNLKYEDEATSVFSLEFPRFEKSKEHLYDEFARILKEWYECNGKGEKYPSYSNAKAVFQAGLKKSVYLISLPAVEKRLVFRFATSEEVKEKRKLIKSKEKAHKVSLGALSDLPNCESSMNTTYDALSVSSCNSSGEDPLYTRYRPPSVSSGYCSGEDPLYAYGSPAASGYYNGEDLLYAAYGSPVPSSCSSGEDVVEKKKVMEHDVNSIDSMLEDLEKYFKCDGEDSSALTDFINDPKKIDLSQIQVACPVQQQNLMMPIVEVKFYWQLSDRMNFDSVLLLAFKKQLFIENEGCHNPGDIIIPNEIWEKREYTWKNAVELDGKLFLFFEKN